MLSEIQLKFGSSTAQPRLIFDPGAVTVFVGPNNSGKSLILSEITSYLEREGAQTNYQIVSDIRLKTLSKGQIKHLLQNLRAEDPTVPEGVITIEIKGGRQRIHLENFASSLSDSENDDFYRQLILTFSIKLDGQARLELTNTSQVQGGVRYKSYHSLSPIVRLFYDKSARARLREIINDAFGLYFTVSPIELGSFSIHFAQRPPQPPDEDEWALDERGDRFFSQTKHIQNFSDGIKAFTGIMATVTSSEYRLILIDEPEAFLHPPLASKLGKRLTEFAAAREGNVFASTHSSSFLMGCVQAGKKVNIVRLTYRDNTASARLLSAERLQEIMRDPLLRSTGVLSTLFHEGAVVCEADKDRAFYQEVNERLLATKEGIADTIFLNAQNKSTIKRIIQPLREMGIPTAAVIDIDILNDKSDFKELLHSAFVPIELITAWGQLKGQIYSRIKFGGKGLTTLDDPSKEAAQSLLDNLAQYGVFIVPIGEVEDWLSYLNVNVDKRNWLPAIFEMMGTDPDDETYVKPSPGDVWDFVRKIARWIGDPSRKGIPT